MSTHFHFVSISLFVLTIVSLAEFIIIQSLRLNFTFAVCVGKRTKKKIREMRKVFGQGEGRLSIIEECNSDEMK